MVFSILDPTWCCLPSKVTIESSRYTLPVSSDSHGQTCLYIANGASRPALVRIAEKMLYKYLMMHKQSGNTVREGLQVVEHEDSQ